MLSAILVLVQFNLDSSKTKKNHVKRKLIETMLVIIAKKITQKKYTCGGLKAATTKILA